VNEGKVEATRVHLLRSRDRTVHDGAGFAGSHPFTSDFDWVLVS